MAEKALAAIQVIFAVILTAIIILQQKGGGVGLVFGGSGNLYSAKRGIDRLLHRATIVISILFFGSILASLIF